MRSLVEDPRATPALTHLPQFAAKTGKKRLMMFKKPNDFSPCSLKTECSAENPLE
jgi:hypothetical protein